MPRAANAAFCDLYFPAEIVRNLLSSTGADNITTVRLSQCGVMKVAKKGDYFPFFPSRLGSQLKAAGVKYLFNSVIAFT